MKFALFKVTLLFLGCSGTAALAKILPEQAAAIPAAATHQVSFTKEIKPILETSCVKCHGRGRSKGGFQIDNRDTFLKGGESGPAVVIGKSTESNLIGLVAGVDPENVMPQKGSKLSPVQIGLLRAWVDQGLAWDTEVSFSRQPSINLKARRLDLPPARKGATNPVDRILQSYFRSKQINSGQVVGDRVFARRVYLDVIGLLPDTQELERFLSDRRSDKRDRLVKRLLADNQDYAEHWLTFWNDLLRNDYKGTGYIDKGRKQITPWLFSALVENKPYNQFVAQLINPTEESEGFIKGIVWRGVVNASQTPPLQAAQNISQVFMGVNLKCASCHDSFINDWTLADAYGLANVYADEPLEIFQCDKPTGHKAQTKFIYPELGTIDPQATRSERLQRLAEIISSEQNGRMSRTIVNRLWARFLGHGLVEPVDEMEKAAWNPDLLDWLASDLVDHDYDLKRTIEVILTSDAYQLPAVSLDEQTRNDYVFRGPSVRSMSGEQYIDALSSLTETWKPLPANAEIDFRAGRSATEQEKINTMLAPIAAQWIWKDKAAAKTAAPLTLYLRKIIVLPEVPTEAVAVVACDNSFTLYLNGKEIASGKDWKKPKVVDLKPHLVKGQNLIAAMAVNESASSDKKANDKNEPEDNPAGFLFYARLRSQRTEGKALIERVWDVVSDSSWLCTGAKFADWEKFDFMAEDWIPAVELGNISVQPWQLERGFMAALSGAALYNRTRASLVASDALMTALGRPNREQVITTRPTAATTLQALELTNGPTLADLLRQGAENLLARTPLTSAEFVNTIYEKAFGRKPSLEEFRLATGLAGQPLGKEGVEDLLWAVTMLPEFQLIY